MQRALIVIGALLIVLGLAWPWLSRLGLGRLPGDIRIETESGGFPNRHLSHHLCGADADPLVLRR